MPGAPFRLTTPALLIEASVWSNPFRSSVPPARTAWADAELNALAAPARSVPAETVGRAVGTSGRASAEKDDIKTMLLKVKVDSVKATDYSCREQ